MPALHPHPRAPVVKYLLSHLHIPGRRKGREAESFSAAEGLTWDPGGAGQELYSGAVLSALSRFSEVLRKGLTTQVGPELPL